MGLFISRHYSS